jgi:protein-L-isoaspartate(D-aspartate) O-methyltransferase
MDIRARAEWMVETQIVSRGVKDPLVLEAMRSVPRHAFVAESLADSAYDDEPGRPLGSHGSHAERPRALAHGGAVPTRLSNWNTR